MISRFKKSSLQYGRQIKFGDNNLTQTIPAGNPCKSKFLPNLALAFRQKVLLKINYLTKNCCYAKRLLI